ARAILAAGPRRCAGSHRVYHRTLCLLVRSTELLRSHPRGQRGDRSLRGLALPRRKDGRLPRAGSGGYFWGDRVDCVVWINSTIAFVIARRREAISLPRGEGFARNVGH